MLALSGAKKTSIKCNTDAEPYVELLHPAYLRLLTENGVRLLPILVRVILVAEPKPAVKRELNKHPLCERRHPIR